MKQPAKKQWETIADSYSDRILTTERIITPGIIASITDLSKKKIMDIGCGAGHLCSMLDKKKAKVQGIDSSSKMIKNARKFYPGITFKTCPAEKLTSVVKEKNFDTAILSMVLACFKHEKMIDDTFSSAAKILKKKGELIIVDLHPHAKRTIKTKVLKHVFPKDSYFSRGLAFPVELVNIKGERFLFHDYHWLLEDYSFYLAKNGFSITEIKDLKPSAISVKAHPELIPFAIDPLFMLIKATKN